MVLGYRYAYEFLINKSQRSPKESLCSLFKDAATKSDCLASSDWMIVYNEFETDVERSDVA
jgi:hypothetical protein